MHGGRRLWSSPDFYITATVEPTIGKRSRSCCRTLCTDPEAIALLGRGIPEPMKEGLQPFSHLMDWKSLGTLYIRIA